MEVTRSLTLKCDAEGCDYEEDAPSVDEKLIGKPCPKCGANLLTREDYEAALDVVPRVEAFADVMNIIGRKAGDQGKETQHVNVSVNPRAGSLDISVRDVED